jgi:phage terminase large subunit
MSVIFVQRGRDGALRLIDYLQDNRKPLDYYVRQLKDKPYNYGTDFIPHDGASKHFLTGKSTQEVMAGMGRQVVVLPRTDVDEGIKLARMVVPRVYIDEARGDKLIDCLQNYKYGVNATTGAYTQPVHDDASHGADAFRYLAVTWRDRSRRNTVEVQPIAQTALEVDDKGRLVNRINIKEWAEQRLRRKQLDL